MDLSDEGLKKRAATLIALWDCGDPECEHPTHERPVTLSATLLALRDAVRAEQREKDAELAASVVAEDGIYVPPEYRRAIAAAIRVEPRHVPVE